MIACILEEIGGWRKPHADLASRRGSKCAHQPSCSNEFVIQVQA